MVTERRLRVGLVIDGADHFLRPIEAELRRRHLVTRFAPRFIRLPLIGKRVNDWLLARQLARFLNGNDVVFFEWAGYLLGQASRLPKRGRIVARMHSIELATGAEQISWPGVDRLIMLNNALLQRLQSQVGSSLPLVAVIANGVDLDRFRFRPKDFQHRLGMVCNLLPIKRVYEAVLSVYELRQAGYLFTLRVAGAAGDGEARRYAWALESVIEKLNLTDAVRFDGFVSNIPDWLADVDIFISNSYWEGQQVALLEAMAAGCYCLGHCWDGIEEILPPENIYTTDGDLRAKLLAYAALPQAEQRAAQAHMRAIAEEKFDQRRMVRQIVELIEEVAGK